MGTPLSPTGRRALVAGLMPLALVATAALHGCYGPEEPDCTYICDPSLADNGSHCPADYECRSDGYCHRVGSTARCSFPPAPDFSTGPDLSLVDLSGDGATPDGGAMPDGAMPDGAMPDGAMPDGAIDAGADLATADGAGPDLAMSKDLAPPPDLAPATDLSATPADLAMPPDMAVPADLALPPDMMCVAANCTSPPQSTCNGQSAVTYATPGSCDVNGQCTYTPASMSCMNGCYGGACTTAFSSIGGTAATDDNGASVPLATTGANAASTAGGPVAATSPVTVTTMTSPGGTVSAVDLFWSLDPTMQPGSTTQVSMKSIGATPSSETWSGSIPAQASGTEVYLYVRATPYSGSQATDPSAAGVHYAYAVQ